MTNLRRRRSRPSGSSERGPGLNESTLLGRAAGSQAKGILALILLVSASLAACGGPPEVEIPATFPPTAGATGPAQIPTPQPPEPTTLVVCLAEEPASLYVYGDTNTATDAVLAAIYDGPIDMRQFSYVPVILERLPSLADGDATLEPTSIASGDVYLNPESLEPDTLASGKPYLPSGCYGWDCVATFRGGSVEVDRLEVQFHLRKGLTWSDGTPLQAGDSVFSFRLDGDPATPSTKYLYARTLSYEALDSQTVEWIGIPGFLDTEYAGNFWIPLPEHALGGLSAEQVQTSDAARRTPLGWGAYQMVSWTAGQEIELEANPRYFRADEGLPAFDRLVFRFLEGSADSALDQLRTGECDVLDESLLNVGQARQLQALAEQGDLHLASLPGALVERLDFNLQPVDSGQPRLFKERATREAIDLCLDAPGIRSVVLGEAGVVTDSYLPAEHPFYTAAEQARRHDPVAGMALLEEVGWRPGEDDEASGTLVASGVPGVANGTPLSFELLLPEGDMYASLGEQVAEDLAECGIEVRLRAVATDELFQAWPEGPVFGRGFEAVIWAWPALVSPPCEMFAGWEVPSAENPLGFNASGLEDPQFDSSCRTVLLGPPDAAVYLEAVRGTQSVFARRKPALPLFVRPRLMAHAPWLCAVELDPSAATGLVGLEAYMPCPQAEG